MWLVATILNSTDVGYFYHHKTYYCTGLVWMVLKAIISDEFIYRMNVDKKRNRPRTEPWTTIQFRSLGIKRE